MSGNGICTTYDNGDIVMKLKYILIQVWQKILNVRHGTVTGEK